MPSEVKELMVRELAEKFQDLPRTGCVLVSFEGLDAEEAMRLRRDIDARGGEMTVVRNRLFALVCRDLGMEKLESLLDGPVAVVRASDPIEAARAAREAHRACEAVKVRGAFVEGNVHGPEAVERLAAIPGRDVLLARLAGAFMAPLQRLAFALLAKPRALLSGLEQLKQQKGEAG